MIRYIYSSPLTNCRTSIESSIITRDAKGFRKYIIRFAAAMLPIALVNNMLRCVFASSLLLVSLDLSDTTIYEP